jgi:coenzyme F420-reducing hydrogenase gamma subunit
VEGAITTERDLREIKKVREMSKILIGMGNCTITGMPTCQRNNFNEEQTEAIKEDLEKFDFLEKCLPVKEVVHMDDEVPGCPMDEKKFIEVLEKYL